MKNFKIKVIIGFVIFALIFFSIDWVTKYFIFDETKVEWQNQGTYSVDTEIDYKIIGFRSVAHDNSTIFSALNFYLPDWAHYIINFSIAMIFVTIPFFTKSLFLGISCGIIFSGILGNSLDKFFSMQSNYYEIFWNKTFVRDIFYIPWFDRGTFNFADVSIILGSSFLIIYIVVSNIKEFKKSHA